MTRVLDCLKLAALASVVFLCVCAGLWFITLERETKETARAARETAAGLRSDLQAWTDKLDAKGDLALAELSVWRVTADRQLTAISERADQQLTVIRVAADTRTGETLGRVDTALGEIHELSESLAPILSHAASVSKQLDEAAELFLNCDHNPSCVFNLAQGTEKAIEKAAQNLGAMSAEVRSALPAALSGIDHIVANSDRTSAASAELMGNLAEASRPLPRWLRIPFSITGAIAPTVAGSLAGAAATGAFR